MPTPSKADQDREARERNEGRDIDPLAAQNEAGAGDGVDADAEGAEPSSRAEPPKPAEPPRRTPPTRVDPRDEIVRRIRADRDAEGPSADLQSAMDPYLPESLRAPRAQPEPEIEPEPEPERQPQPPPKHKVKVRGREIELTDDEVFEAARKHLAAEDYFEEARTTADRAKAALKDIEDRVRSTTRPSEPPAPVKSAPAEGSPEGDEPPVDPFEEAVRELQFGEPEEAGKKLRQIIGTAAREQAQQIVMADRLQDELTKSKSRLEAFGEEHKEFLADEMLHAAATQRVYSIMRQELTKVGVPAEQLSSMSNDDVGGLHMRFRAGRQSVTQDIGEIFKRAHGDVEARFGTPAPRREQEEEPPARPPSDQQQSKASTTVSVDRSQRRLLISQQPTRSAARQPVAAPERPAREDPSDVIARMAERRKPVAHNAR